MQPRLPFLRGEGYRQANVRPGGTLGELRELLAERRADHFTMI